MSNYASEPHFKCNISIYFCTQLYKFQTYLHITSNPSENKYTWNIRCNWDKWSGSIQVQHNRSSSTGPLSNTAILKFVQTFKYKQEIFVNSRNHRLNMVHTYWQLHKYFRCMQYVQKTISLWLNGLHYFPF